MINVHEELIHAIETLDSDQQEQVLRYVQSIHAAKPRGERLGDLIAHAREIAFPKEDLEEIARFIEEEFRQVRGDELDVPSFDP